LGETIPMRTFSWSTCSLLTHIAYGDGVMRLNRCMKTGMSHLSDFQDKFHCRFFACRQICFSRLIAFQLYKKKTGK
ncbi:hypothetical protein HID58_017851, partial [Brassica napus]